MTAAERTTTLRHAVGFYSSQAHLVSQIADMVRTAMAGGEPVALALRPATDAAVRDTVGRPDGIVSMEHPEGPPGRSGQTLVAARSRDLRRTVALHGSAVLITEHHPRYDGPGGRFWTELDAAANIALADLPVRVTCFFPESTENPGVLEGARRNHALVLVCGALRPNPEYRDPCEVLAGSPVPPPPDLRPPDVDQTFGVRQLVRIRTLIEDAMLRASVVPERVEDVSLAVNEVATNAVQHGADEARFRMWAEPDRHVFEVHDRGVLRDVLPGMAPPHPAQRDQRGLWIARQLCDYLHVWTDGDGTHVRILVTA